ncbi:GntR family transcriptional regulator [Limoniibacter endophyticus]|uniref:GntR family transcriptional regulator n=1 Tax=Limoniibacter endophyticus TaxID=1565040 RepID=A0A8J3DNC7_9HYPH|nr:GntR family transcriptional regulator [Limoniibacter endophyticus]GHC67465.1 GntR family transcriptional regulator [Limoniibacter endophyticus]
MNDMTASPMPRYHQIYLLLRQKIMEGVWPEGTPMPSENELTLAHNVSRITIRSALSRLESEGLIFRRQGAGTFVRPPKPERRSEKLQGLLENLVEMGLRTEVKLLSFTYVAAPADIARHLNLKTGSVVQKSVRIRSSKGVPFSYLTTWVPEDIGHHYRPEDMAERPLLAIFRDIGFPPADAEQTISCKLADNIVAPLLQVELASPLLWVQRDVRSKNGRQIEYIEALYRPDMYEYKINLVHEGDVWSHLDADPAAN